MKEQRIDRINRWLTLGANIGVVLGLIILIVEVRQNAALTRTELETAKADLMARLEFTFTSPGVAAAWMKSIRSPETLTDEEIRIVEAQLVGLMMQWDHLLAMKDSGLATRARVERHIRNTAPYYFGSRFAKNWWRREAAGWEGTGMFEIAGPIVEGLDSGFLARHYDALRLPPETPGSEHAD